MSGSRLRDLIAAQIGQHPDVADVTFVRGVGGVFQLKILDDTDAMWHVWIARDISRDRSGKRGGQ